jgi:hypothetical protein
MSEDISRAAATAAEPKAETVRVRRLTAILNGASALLLFGAACAVIVGATPALLRTLLARGRSVSVSTEADHLMPHPRSERADEPSGATRTPHGTFRHDRKVLPDLPNDAEHPYKGDDPGVGDVDPKADELGAAEERKGSSVRLGLARKTLSLYAEPGGAGDVLGKIEAGEQVVIIKEAGPWALVFQSGKMGWTKKSEIAVR